MKFTKLLENSTILGQKSKLLLLARIIPKCWKNPQNNTNIVPFLDLWKGHWQNFAKFFQIFFLPHYCTTQHSQSFCLSIGLLYGYKYNKYKYFWLNISNSIYKKLNKHYQIHRKYWKFNKILNFCTQSGRFLFSEIIIQID